MTAPDPLAAHTSAAQQRILTAAEKHALTPADRLVLLRNALGNYRRGRHSTISDRQLAALVDDLADVVEQLAGQMGGAPLEAWFGAWECGCTDTERTPLGIPEFCPEHGRKLISNGFGSTKVQLNHSGVSGYGFKAGPS